MDPVVARDVALRLHGGQRTRFGEPVLDHLGHAAIPEDAPPYAWARRRVAMAHARDVDADPRRGSDIARAR